MTDEEKAFFKRLVPLSYIVSEWTMLKAQFLNLPSQRGVLPSIILSDILLMSDYGKHPISKDDCNNKYSHNLALLKVDARWKGKVNIFEEESYRAYKNWRYFGEDYSDYLTFSRKFDNLLISNNFIDQAAHLSFDKPSSSCYHKEMIKVYNLLGLEDFDGKIKR